MKTASSRGEWGRRRTLHLTILLRDDAGAANGYYLSPCRSRRPSVFPQEGRRAPSSRSSQVTVGRPTSNLVLRTQGACDAGPRPERKAELVQHGSRTAPNWARVRLEYRSRNVACSAFP